MSGCNIWRKVYQDWENDVIRAVYPDGGLTALQAALKHRTKSSLYRQASRLKVKVLYRPVYVKRSSEFGKLPIQDYADDHREWMKVDRSIIPLSPSAVLGFAI